MGKIHEFAENISMSLIFNGPAILCILSAPFLFQLTRRTSRETQQVFDWLISILHLGQMLSTVVFHSVCQFHVSGEGQKILFALQCLSGAG
jgi:hypothetical protein